MGKALWQDQIIIYHWMYMAKEKAEWGRVQGCMEVELRENERQFSYDYVSRYGSICIFILTTVRTRNLI